MGEAPQEGQGPPGTVEPMMMMMMMMMSAITGLDRPRGFQEVKILKFRDNGTGWW